MQWLKGQLLEMDDLKEVKDTRGRKKPVNEFFWILHILFSWVLLTKYQIFWIGFQATFEEMQWKSYRPFTSWKYINNFFTNFF